MSKMSQKDAVHAAVTAFLHENNRRVEEGIKVELSKDERLTVVAMLVAAVQSDRVTMSVKASAKYFDDQSLSEYAGSLLSNWLRKDIRLNGGTKHKIKKPGARVGNSDDVVKSLRKLKKQLSSDIAIEAVDQEIERRLIDLGKERRSKIDTSILPDAIKHMVG